MEKKINRIYLVFSLCFLAALLLWGFFGIRQLKNKNTEEGQVLFIKVKETVTASFLVDNRFDSPFFKEAVENLFKKEPSLRSLLIFSADKGIEYLFAVDSSYFSPSIEESLEMKKRPVYKVNRLSEQLFSSRLLIPSASTALDIDIIYQTLNRGHILNILKQILIALIGFQILTALLLIVLQLTSPGKVKTDNLEKREEKREKDDPASLTAAPPLPRSSGEKQPSSLFSDRSGLGWEYDIGERLNAELSKAASFDQDLTCLALNCSFSCDTATYKNLGIIILDYFKFRDLTFELGQNGFLIILKNTDLDKGIYEAEAFIKIIDAFHRDCNIKAGLSSRNGRLIGAEIIVKETKRALERALEDRENRIIAFRTDPAKYRQFLASRR